MGEAYFKIQDYDRAMGRYVLMRTYLIQVSSIADISDIFQVSSCTRWGRVAPDCVTVELQQKIGQLYILKDEYSEAQAVLIQCLTTEKANIARILLVLEVLLEIAYALFEQEQHKHCIVYFQEALRIKKLLGETGTVASIQNQLGMSYLNLGKFDEGMRTFQEIRFHHSNSFQNVDHRQSELAHLAYNIGRAHVGLEEKDMGRASYLDAIDRYSLSHMHIGNGLLSKCSHDIPTFKKGVEDKQTATIHDQIAGIFGYS